MSTLKRALVVGWSDEDLDEFTCGICHDILMEPMVSDCCRQTYCKNCIEQWLTNNNSCPNDRSLLTTNELSEAPRMVYNVLGNIKMKCRFYENGCDVIVKLSKFEDHLKSCQFNKCKKCGSNIDKEHDCLEVLKDENQRLSLEINQLRIENERISNLLLTKEQNTIDRGKKTRGIGGGRGLFRIHLGQKF